MTSHDVTDAKPYGPEELEAFAQLDVRAPRAPMNEHREVVLRFLATIRHREAVAERWANATAAAERQIAALLRDRNHNDALMKAEAGERRCRQVLEKWVEYHFCCSDTPSKEKLDKMLAEVEDATMELLSYKVGR